MSVAHQLLGRAAIVDVETTGLDPSRAHLIEVGVVFVEPGRPLRRASWAVRPPIAVPAVITALTGLDDAALAEAHDWATVRPLVAEALAGWVLVAHNADFERAFLGDAVSGATFLDSCLIAHLLAPELPSHALDALVRWAGVGLGARHRAIDDAEDTLRVLEVLLTRAAAGPQTFLDGLERQLSRGLGEEVHLLRQLVTRLRAARMSAGMPSTPGVVSEPALEHLLADGLATGTTVRLEVERPGATAAALTVASAEDGDGAPCVVAVPRDTLRALAATAPIPVVQRHPTCRRRLAAQLDAPPAEAPGEALSSAYLGALVARSPLLVPSRWFIHRHPEVSALLQAAGRCRCEGLGCASTTADAEDARALLVTHELALDWLEQRLPMRLCVLEAEALPAAEARRRSTRLDAAKLEGVGRGLPGGDPLARALPHHRRALDEALRSLDDAGRGLVVASRLAAPWLRVREALSSLGKDVRSRLERAPGDEAVVALAAEVARLTEPPEPGLRTVARGGPKPHLALEPEDAGALAASRLRGAVVLVSNRRGALGWAPGPLLHVGASSRPSVRLEACARGLTPVVTRAGELATQLGGPVALLMDEPVGAAAEALRAIFPELAVRSVPGAAAPGGACVTLVPWPGQRAPDALVTLVAPVSDVRRAALDCGEREVVVLTPPEAREAFSAALSDLLDAG